MSARLGRYIFRKINGRIVPIRVGAEAKAVEGFSGVSRKISAIAKNIEKHTSAKLSKSGKFTLAPESVSGTSAMHKFMKSTGAIRFSQFGKSTTIDFTHKLTDPQRKSLHRLIEDTEVFAGRNSLGKEFPDAASFLRSELSRTGKALKRTKLGDQMEAKALKEFGTTNHPKEVGYITQRGQWIDLSGKKYGGSGGTRELDHREVSQFVPFPKAKAAKQSDLTKLAREAQNRRKDAARYTHRLDIAKRDAINIQKWEDNSESAKKIKQSYLAKLNELIAEKRKRSK